MARVLLVSNPVMHYRVPVYNYLARRFREHGDEFVVRASRLQKENPHALGFDFAELPFSFDRYRREIQRLQPDVVITFLRMKDVMLWPLVHWLKVRGTPVAFWMKAMNYDRPDSLASRAMYRYMHRCADGLVLYSSHELGLLPAYARAKAFAANNTINFESYPEIHETREEIRRDLGLPFDRIVLSVGRMGAEGQRKKVHHLIEVFRNITTPGLGLVIVGSGMTPDLLERVNPENTRYLGEIYDPQERQISRIFKAADVFSIPGHVGLGLNQAFYWGLPVVTEEGRQPPEIHYLVNGRNGYIVPEDDLEALKARLLELLTDDDLRRRFSEQARADILTHASIEGMFQGFKSCVDSLIGRRRAAA